jgi:hypothetical protein
MPTILLHQTTLMRTINIVIALVLLSLSLTSCKKQINSAEEISQEVKDKIFALGFSTESIQKIDEGYLAEGDIVLSNSDLDHKPQTEFLNIAGNEQYRTFNLLTGLPRTLTISLSTKFPFTYGAALDEAIRRYNDENLQIHFQRANSGGDIEIIKAHGNFVGSSGLPSSTGVPYRTIKINSSLIGNGKGGSTFINYLATLMAHEIGHCIGFRHTDYLDRSFSCAGRSVNEGAGYSGAVNISGTPVSSDSGSWMLACITINQNRPFNDNDKIALSYLY